MHSPRSTRGMALISALLLLVVMTILGVAMFRSFGSLERIAGNTREKQRALHAATSAQTYAEWWLTASGGINATTGTNCGAGFVTAPANAQVCSNLIANVNTVPWGAGVYYQPLGLQVGNVGVVTGVANNYVFPPAFYISFINQSFNNVTGTKTSSYQIDAMGYAGNTSSVAVAESAFNVSVTYTSQDSLKKYLNHGGP
jgi:type IV pilus assembly protein PilX